MKIRNARASDSSAIIRLVDGFADRNIMLPVTEDYLFEHINDYFVAETGKKIVGTVFLRVYSDLLAEIRSLAVDADFQHHGVGRHLIHFALKRAKTLGITRILALTLVPDFFRKLGFKEVDKSLFPEKIWTDCETCTKKDNCDEISMLMEMSASP
jgi:amino-acid N-acetyltransferase